jgi:uncharacterized repeat protein (TIGR01451 family)
VTVETISDGGTETGAGEVVWRVGRLAVGETLHREITVTADAVSKGDILKLAAELSHNNGPENDNRSEFTITVAQSGSQAALLSLDIAAAPDPVGAGDILVYTIELTNNYGLPVTNVTILLRLSGDTSFNKVNDADPDIACRGSVCDNVDEASLTLDTLASGANQVITINATVDAGIGDGNMIVSPFMITADDMEDVINLQHTTVIGN